LHNILLSGYTCPPPKKIRGALHFCPRTPRTLVMPLIYGSNSNASNECHRGETRIPKMVYCLLHHCSITCRRELCFSEIRSPHSSRITKGAEGVVTPPPRRTLFHKFLIRPEDARDVTRMPWLCVNCCWHDEQD